ncbi:unnamed protein product, partial [marine sediment metagenome]
MAYSFSDNEVVVTNTTEHPVLQSYAVWLYRTGTGGQNYGEFISKGLSNTIQMYHDDGNSETVFLHSWSTSHGAWGIA